MITSMVREDKGLIKEKLLLQGCGYFICRKVNSVYNDYVLKYVATFDGSCLNV
jgi:hypothetical protein